MTTIDIQRVRSETPGCEDVVHFNNAGCSLPPQVVRDVVRDYLDVEARTGGYETAERYQAELEGVYDSISGLIGCGRDEVAILESATRAWGSVFHALSFQPGDKILTSRQEYASNFIAMLQIASRKGVVIEAIDNDEAGAVSVDALRSAIDSSVKLIALTHISTSNGLVNPAAEVGKIAREAGVLYLLDACQSVGQMTLDVRELGCDFLSATGRKFLRAPRGTALLYVRRDLCRQLEPIFLDLHAVDWTAADSYSVHGDARRFETWERNYAGQLGLGAAVEYARRIGLDAIRQRVAGLADLLRVRLADIPGVTVHDRGTEKCGIVTFTKHGVEPDHLRIALGERSINVWTSPVASSRLDMEHRGLSGVVRASVHYYNTEEEVERVVEELLQVRR